jgi:hypothetical protein
MIVRCGELERCVVGVHLRSAHTFIPLSRHLNHVIQYLSQYNVRKYNTSFCMQPGGCRERIGHRFSAL